MTRLQCRDPRNLRPRPPKGTRESPQNNPITTLGNLGDDWGLVFGVPVWYRYLFKLAFENQESQAALKSSTLNHVARNQGQTYGICMAGHCTRPLFISKTLLREAHPLLSKKCHSSHSHVKAGHLMFVKHLFHQKLHGPPYVTCP